MIDDDDEVEGVTTGGMVHGPHESYKLSDSNHQLYSDS